MRTNPEVETNVTAPRRLVRGPILLLPIVLFLIAPTPGRSQEDDGTLKARFVPEMISRTDEDLPLVSDPKDGAALSADAVTVNGGSGFRAVPLTGIPRDMRITFRVVPREGVRSDGIGLRSVKDLTRSLEVQADLDTGLVRLFEVDGDRRRANTPANQRHRLDNLDAPLTIDLVCRRDIVDVEIGGRRTLIRKYWELNSARIYLFAEGGEVRFEDVRICPIVE